MKTRLETATNLAIIVLCVTVSAVLVKTHLLPRMASPPQIASGDVLGLPESAGLDQAERTLVLALSPTCRYCTESLPFYRELAASLGAQSSPMRIVGVVEGEENLAEERRILGDEEVRFDALLSVDFESLGISGTPLAILVDRQGKAIEVWKGKLSESGESQLRRSLGLA